MEVRWFQNWKVDRKGKIWKCLCCKREKIQLRCRYVNAHFKDSGLRLSHSFAYAIFNLLFSTEDSVQETDPWRRFATSSETWGRNSVSFETQKYLSTLWILSRWQKAIYNSRILQKWNTVEKIKGSSDLRLESPLLGSP